MLHNRALNINKNAQNTALLFNVYKNKTYEFADLIVKCALLLGWDMIEINPKFCVYKLVIDGFAGTKQSNKFLTDTILRFELLNNGIFDSIETKFTSEPSSYNLKQLSKLLPSLPRYNKDFIAMVLDNPKKYEDLYFWAMKAQMELLIKQGYTQSYFTLLEWALEQFPQKEYSTLKAKAKSIFNWYHARGFKVFRAYERKYTKENLSMTRSENMKRIKALQKAKTIGKIKEMLDKNSLFGNEYYKKDGSVNVSKLSRDMKMSLAYIRKVVIEIGVRNG